MANINFFALGGLDEKAKACYVLEIDSSIYIFNTGAQNPISESLGISRIVPDYNYLVENKSKIKAIIFGTPNHDNISSLDYFLEKVGYDIPIVTSEIGKYIILSFLGTKYKMQNVEEKLTFNIVNAMRDFNIGSQLIVPIKIFNSMPGSLGYIFKTADGSIVYLDNFIISTDKSKAFYSQIHNIRDILKNSETLLLITQTGIVDTSKTFTSPFHNNMKFYEEVISNTNKRVLIAIHNHDAYSAFNIAQVARKYQKNFIIHSREFVNTFQATIKVGLFNNKGLLSIPLNDVNNSNNAIVLIVAEPENLFGKISKIFNGTDDKVIIKPEDTFVLGTKIINGLEGHSAKLLDEIARLDIKTITMPKSYLPLEPGNEDHKFLASLIQPKYIIPVGGLYKSFIQYANVVDETWINKDQVIILENGQKAEFGNGILTSTKNRIPFESIPLSSFGIGDIGSSLIYERSQMSNNGVVIINFFINKEFKIISKIDIHDIGLINQNDENSFNTFNRIKEDIRNNIHNYFVFKNKTSLDFKETKISIKKAVIKLIDKNLEKRPLILPTIIESKE